MRNEYTHKSLMSGLLCMIIGYEGEHTKFVDEKGSCHLVLTCFSHMLFAPLQEDEKHDYSI